MENKEYIELEKLVDCIIDNRGKTVPTSNTGIPLIATNCIKFSSLYPVFENVRYINEDTYENWFRSHLQPDDILFVNKGTPGRCCLVPDPVNFVGAQDMVGLRFKKHLNPYYMLAILRSKGILKTIENNHVGLVIAHFRKQELVKLKLPIVSSNLRNKIGDFYRATSVKIELNNKINAELEQMAKTLYDYWFVQFDFPDENGKPYKSSGGEMVYNDILKREIPKGWEVKNLFKVSAVQYGFPFSTDFFNENNIGVPIIRIRDILNNSISNYSDQENIDDKYIIHKGDILVGMDGNFHINYWTKNDCYLNQRVVMIKETSLPNIYTRYQIEPLIQLREKSVSRTTVGHLSDKDLKEINLIIPSKEILNVIKPLFDTYLQKIVSNKRQNQELAQLRDWLLPMLMNGQIKIK